MPFFEITLISRVLVKAELFECMKRSAITLMQKGGIIEQIDSLGHRDLPYKRLAKVTKDPVYSTNTFIFHTHVPLEEVHPARLALFNDNDLVHVHFVNKKLLKPTPGECNLDDLLKPPPFRPSVIELRQNQKIGHLRRQLVYRKTQNTWREIPKSYGIPSPKE